MVITYLFFLLGLIFLVRGANWIVDSSSSIAKRLGVSGFIIGLTIVAFGTSLPELVVNLMAAFAGDSEIIFGNVVGSNIANILFVLGVVACFGNVVLKREVIRHEIPFSLFTIFILFVLTGNLFGAKEFLTRDDGLILLGLFAVFVYYIFSMARKNGANLDVRQVVDKSNLFVILKLVLGIVMIYFGGRFVVEGAVVIASQLGLSEFLISATIIALGTSLPELVVSVFAIRKGNAGLAIGNIIGSNIFNICWVLGIVPFISPVRIPEFVGFDIGVMAFSTLVLLILVFAGKKRELRRKDGMLLLLFYLSYVWYAFIRG